MRTRMLGVAREHLLRHRPGGLRRLIGLVQEAGRGQVRQGREGSGFQVVGKRLVNLCPSLLVAFQPAPFVALLGVGVVGLQRPDIGLFPGRLAASGVGQREKLVSLLELRF